MNATTLKVVVAGTAVVTTVIAKRQLSKMFANAISNEPTDLRLPPCNAEDTAFFVK